jgi:PAS domain S-box-containing protein
MDMSTQFREITAAFAKEFRRRLAEDRSPIIFHLSEDLRLINISPQFDSLYYFPHAMLDQPISFYHDPNSMPETVSQIIGLIKQTFKTRKGHTVEWTLFGDIPVRVSIMPFYTSLNNLTGVVISLICISGELEDRIQLEKQNRRLEFALSHSRMTIWEADFTTDTLTVDKNFTSVLGFPIIDGKLQRTIPSLEELLQLCHPSQAEQLHSQLGQIFSTNRTHIETFDLRLKHQSTGRWVWVRNGGIIVKRDEQGQHEIMIGYTIDITREKERELQLEHETFFLNETQRTTHMGYSLSPINSETMHWSEELYRIFGFEPYEISPSFTLVESMIHYRGDDTEVFANLQAAKTTTEDLSYTMEIERRSGEIRILRVRVHPVRGDLHEGTHTLTVVSDITDMVRKEQQMINQKEQLEAILAYTHTGYWSYDRYTGRYTLSPAAKELYFGTADVPDELIDAAYIRQVIHPDDLILWEDDHTLSQSTPGKKYSHSCRVVRPDQSVVTLMVTANPQQDQRTVFGYWGLIQKLPG